MLLGHLPTSELALQLLHWVALETLDALEKGRSRVALSALLDVSAAQKPKSFHFVRRTS